MIVVFVAVLAYVVVVLKVISSSFISICISGFVRLAAGKYVFTNNKINCTNI